MAKTEGFSFTDLDKQLSKISGFETGSLLETNTFSEVDEWIPTGNYLLNAQISGTLFGGYQTQDRSELWVILEQVNRSSV